MPTRVLRRVRCTNSLLWLQVSPPAWMSVAGSGARSAEVPRVVGVEQAQEPGHAPLQAGHRVGWAATGRSPLVGVGGLPQGQVGRACSRPAALALPLCSTCPPQLDRMINLLSGRCGPINHTLCTRERLHPALPFGMITKAARNQAHKPRMNWCKSNRATISCQGVTG
jgi:hypothetical protein